MKRIETLSQLKREQSKVKFTSDAIWFIAQALMFFIENSCKKRPKRKASKWSLFAGKQMSKGKSLKEAAEMWKERKIK